MAKRKVREGGPQAPGNAAAMVVTRQKMREYYRFMSEDMGITFEFMERTPFYRIMLLNPSGLDELWRIKKVCHPDNISATKYVLFEEILSDRSMEEILLTPQRAPYYEPVDSIKHPEMDDEFQAIAEELNKDKKFFRRNREGGSESAPVSQKDLIKNTKKLRLTLAKAAGKAQAGMPGIPGGSGSAFGGAASGATGKMSGMKKNHGSIGRQRCCCRSSQGNREGSFERAV